MSVTLNRPTRMTATEVSRGFAAVLERAKHGESFLVTKSGQPVAQIMPPPVEEPNGARILEFLRAWPGDESGFTDEIVAALDEMGQPNERDEERMAWVDDYR